MRESRPLIRQATPTDAPAVAALINAINSLDGLPPDIPMTPDLVLRDLIGPTPRALLLLAELDAEVVGFATAGTIYDAIRVADAIMLLDLYVAPHARRRGAARALMAALAAEAVRREAGCIWWGVDDGDDEAMEFYRAIGSRIEEHFTGRILEGTALRRLAGEAR